MRSYKFVFAGKEYELREDNCDYFKNEEEHPVGGIDLSGILELLNQAEEVEFNPEYYDQPCEECFNGKEEKAKYFKFLEFHFYLFAKQGEYVSSSISQKDENSSYSKLYRQGKVDNSYIVSVSVCINCGSYAVEIEQCDV